MFRPSSLPDQNASLPCQVEMDQVAFAGDIASQRSTWLLWIAQGGVLGFAILMMIGISMHGLHPLASHAATEPSRFMPEVAFSTVPGIRAAGHPLRVITKGHARFAAPLQAVQTEAGSREALFPVPVTVGGEWAWKANRGPMIHPVVDLPHLKMLVPEEDIPGLASDDDKPDASKSFVPSPLAASNTPLRQTFPPTQIDAMDATTVLMMWYFDDVFNLKTSIKDIFKKDKHDDRAAMLGTMRQSYNSIEPLEAVVSIPQGSSPSDASVLAVGLFSRQQLEDDRGLLRFKIEEQYGAQETRQWLGSTRNLVGRRKQLDVFAIFGLANAPGFSERSTRILLSKIEKYAHTQQRLVVVLERACISSDGIDLTDYYVRLGFEKVELTDGPSLLVYTGASRSTTDTALENDQVMIGILDVWDRKG